MDNLNTHSEHADRPQGQQADGLPFAVPPSQVLDSHTHAVGQQNIDLWPFWFSLEQQRLQLDQILRLHYEQEMFVQNAMQRQQEDVVTALLDREQWIQLAAVAYEVNQSLICRLLLVQQQTNSHVSSNSFDAPRPGGGASSMSRTAAETANPGLICKVCNSGDASVLLLPCQHLCACEPCGVRLMTCPICGAVKSGAIKAQLG